MNKFELMENNISMNYIDLLIMIFFLILTICPIIIIIYLILNSSIHLVITSNIDNTNAEVKVSFKYFFNLINITKTIYPISKSDGKKKETKNNKKEKNSKKIDLKKIELENLLVVYRTMRKVKISEIYSDLSYGNENIQITTFSYVLINSIYGHIINYFNPQKAYMKVTPDYTKNYIKHKSVIHVSPTIKDILALGKGILKIYIKIKKYKKVKYGKEEDTDEVSKFYKKFNGHNS